MLSTLPSAGVGAVLALLMFRMEFSIIALIGVFLLIGIVKKNAILIIDFALEAQRSRGLTRHGGGARGLPAALPADPDDHHGRRPGRLPLAIGFGEGAELRRPLGVAIIGGLIASQLLTLMTTPVVYVLHGQAAPPQPTWSASSAAAQMSPTRRHPAPRCNCSD